MIDTIYLMNRGFEMRQINQLVALDELGYDLSEIDVLVDVDTLKTFRKNIENKVYSESKLATLKEFADKGLNITQLIKYNWEITTIDRLGAMLEAGVDISGIDDKFNVNQITELWHAACVNGTDISYLINSEIPAPLIEKTCIIADRRPDYEPTLKEIYGNNLDIERIRSLVSAIYDCLADDKLIDVKPLMTDKYDSKQVRIILEGLRHDINILDYCDERYNSYQMSCIYTGLTSDVDVTLFNKLRYDEYQMDTILAWLMYLGNDNEDINTILDDKLNPAQMELLISRKSAGMDISLFEDRKYTYEQMFAIYTGIKKGIDVNIYKDTGLSGEEMYTVMNALKMQKEGYDIDIEMFLNPEIKLEDKLKNLISKLNIPTINLNAETLDEKINEIDLNEFYNHYSERDDDEIIRVQLSNGSSIIFTPSSLDVPMNNVAYFEEDYSIEESFVETYKEEIDKLTEILSFIKYENNQYCLYNLLKEKMVETLELDIDCCDEYEIDYVYEKVIEETASYLSGDEYYDYSPLFFDTYELAQYGGPDPEKLVIMKNMQMFTDNMYAIERDFKTNDINNIKKLFNELYCKFYAFYSEDTFTYQILDKDGKETNSGVWYGSYDLERRIKEEFKSDVINISDEHEKFDDERKEDGWEYEDDDRY